MNKKRNTGFTIIELLVVIAVIGILAVVAMASLQTTRLRGGNSAIKSNFANMRGQALLYSNANFKYNTTGSAITCTVTAAGVASGCAGSVFDTDANNGIQKMMLPAAVAANTTVTGYVDAAGLNWAVNVPLRTSETVNGTTYNHYCADSANNAKLEVSALAPDATICN